MHLAFQMGSALPDDRRFLTAVLLAAFLARVDSPLLYEGLTQGHTAMVMNAVTALAAATAFWARAGRRFQVARLAAR